MITDGLENFVESILQNLEDLGVDVSGLEMDHFGYQASSKKDYDELKEEVSELGEMKSENIVGGRRVSVYELLDPIKIKNFEITAFELIEPKEGQNTESILDHIEFVLEDSFEEFIDMYSDVDWDTVAMNRDEFPKVAYRFDDGSGVKFHLENILEEV